jgi:hypothetical protein
MCSAKKKKRKKKKKDGKKQNVKVELMASVVAFKSST